MTDRFTGTVTPCSTDHRTGTPLSTASARYTLAHEAGGHFGSGYFAAQFFYGSHWLRGSVGPGASDTTDHRAGTALSTATGRY